VQGDARLLVRWEGNGVLALLKPPGLPVFPLSADPSGDSVLARLLRERPDQAAHPWPSGFLGGIAHRLDNATSGQLLAARDPAVLARLREDFAAGRLRKRYAFLTARRVPWTSHRIEAALAHDRHRPDRMVVRRGHDTPHRGRWYAAATELHYQGGGESLHAWEATIATGVMHQVRLHAAFSGIALAGDRLYGGGPLPFPAPVPFLLHHLGLHGPGLAPPPFPLPGWWPASIGVWLRE
jgi:23S rRNA-/tRNA-specific pseudouridylate synthase